MHAETEQRSKDIFDLLHKNAAKQATAAENSEKLIAFAGKSGKTRLAKAPVRSTPNGLASPVRVKADPSLSRAVAEMHRGREDSRAYLFAVGIEDYKAAPSVPYAENSLRIMAALLAKKYGIPKGNQVVLFGEHATGQAIQGNIRNLAARMTENDVLFFYYAGHGLAGKNGQEVYMLPSDAVRGAYEDKDFALNQMITKQLGGSARIYAILDTCFSGRADKNTMLTRGVAPVYKTTPHKLPDNVTVFFAGQGDQFANHFPAKGHRLFSYLSSAILDGKTDVRETELFVKGKVRDTSTRMGRTMCRCRSSGERRTAVWASDLVSQA